MKSITSNYLLFPSHIAQVITSQSSAGGRSQKSFVYSSFRHPRSLHIVSLWRHPEAFFASRSDLPYCHIGILCKVIHFVYWAALRRYQCIRFWRLSRGGREEWEYCCRFFCVFPAMLSSTVYSNYCVTAVII